MGKGDERRLKVWAWSGRDPVSLHDLDFVVAAFARSDLHAASVRLRLPKPDFGEPSLLKPTDPRAVLATHTPGRVLFRETSSGDDWQDEENLTVVRSESTALQKQAGRVVPPLHRT